jgi:hypothetical protein
MSEKMCVFGCVLYASEPENHPLSRASLAVASTADWKRRSIAAKKMKCLVAYVIHR